MILTPSDIWQGNRVIKGWSIKNTICALINNWLTIEQNMIIGRGRVVHCCYPIWMSYNLHNDKKYRKFKSKTKYKIWLRDVSMQTCTHAFSPGNWGNQIQCNEKINEKHLSQDICVLSVQHYHTSFPCLPSSFWTYEIVETMTIGPIIEAVTRNLLGALRDSVRSGMVTATMTILQTMFPSSQAETFYISLASGAPPLWPPLSVFAPISHLALLFAPATDCQKANAWYMFCVTRPRDK